MSISDRVIAIIAEQALLEPSDVTPESTLEDLGIDSMGLVESIFATFLSRLTQMNRKPTILIFRTLLRSSLGSKSSCRKRSDAKL